MPTILVTFDPQEAQPIHVPDANVQIPKGTHEIEWVPVNCTFSPNTGISFAPTTHTPDIWTQSAPAFDSATGNYKVTDVNNGGSQKTFNYNIAVKAPGGTRHKRFDPDITNTP